MNTPVVESQINKFLLLLREKSLPRDHPALGAVIKFSKSGTKFSDEDKLALTKAICDCFSFTEEELVHHLVGGNNHKEQISVARDELIRKESELLNMLPKPSWLYDYVFYGSCSESPLAYSVFAGLVLIGATIGRRLWFDMGIFKVYPPMGVIILGPSGVKKTTAADIGVRILNDMSICSIYAEKITPEALVMAFADNAQGLIYAPEASVLMGKQKYNEGLIPLITRLMDCPNSITPTTIARGVTTIKDVACSVLVCSTTDWFIRNTPEDTFRGGFIPRFLLVHQTVSPRDIAIPEPPNTLEDISKTLPLLRKLEGMMFFCPPARTLFLEWYSLNKVKASSASHALIEGYLLRKPVHIIRLAMSVHASTHDSLEICESCLKLAFDLLEWNESFLPSLLIELFKTPQGLEQTFVFDQIKEAGGVISHTMLVRKTQHKLSVSQMRSALSTLKESKHVEEVKDSLQHSWRIL